MRNDEAVDGSFADPRMAGLLAFNQNRKRTSRENLLVAAAKLFCRDGYAAISVEDITAEAGVSRITYYRHFPTKAAMAMELFNRAAGEAAPHMVAIGAQDYRDRATVVAWITDFFAVNREMRGILRVLNQANVEETGFSEQVRPYISDLIAALGKTIPAFDVTPDRSIDQRRWVKGWLLIYTILDQSNHAATTSGPASNPMMIEVLADDFLDFVTGR